jgi:hypothetical protein
MHWVKSASYIDGYKIEIRFENDEVRRVDLENYLDGGIFEALKELSFFKTFAVNHEIDTVVWPNNADFSPDFLYKIGQTISESEDPADS